MPLKTVTIYTDGGCEPNPGPGGYGAVLSFGSARKELSGGRRLTTNNRMELLAAITALQSLKERCHVLLHSDSQYVVNGMTKGWVQNWERANWKRKNGAPIPNADLWQDLAEAAAHHQVDFRWVRGHSGNPLNERCDELVHLARARKSELTIDQEYEQHREQDEEDDSLIATAAPLKVERAPTSPSQDSSDEEDDLEPLPKGNKVTAPGQPCRKCGTPVIKRSPKKRQTKPGQTYYYDYYLFCPNCKTLYLVDAAKRPL